MDQKIVRYLQVKYVNCLELTFPGSLILCHVLFIVFELFYNPVEIEVNLQKTGGKINVSCL